MKKMNLLLLLLMAFMLAACAEDAEEADPADTVEAYLKALVAGNESELVKLACPAREADARRSAVSFQSVDPQLDGMSCKKSGDQGEDAIVTCEGSIIATYEGERTPRPLGSYIVTQVDDEWKWCGEAAASE